MAGVQEVHAAPPASTISQPLARHPESAADARARTATAALSAPSSDDFQSDEEDDDDGASFASVIGSVMDAPDAVGEVASDAANNITDEVREAAGSLASDATRPAGEGIDTLGGVAADALDGIGLDDQAASVRKSTSDYGGIIREMGDTAQDLASSENRVMVPDGSAAPPHALSPDGRLRVVSWNLHHGEGPNDNGTPPQMDAMLERMRAARGDVYLLQEVPPDQAQHIADATGMRGYFTRTTPQQGNMILVHPDLEISRNEKLLVNTEVPAGDDNAARGAVLSWMQNRGSEDGQTTEPRVAQVLSVTTPDGHDALLWNTHLSAVSDNSWRARQADAIASFLESRAAPGEAVIGGGDLNSRAGDDAVERFRADGMDLGSAEIDWIAGLNASVQIERRDTLHDEDGIQLSDHPLLAAGVKF